MAVKGKTKKAIKVLKQGGILLYPTEGVYGLGCDPFNETAVLRLLKIKRRKVKKGLILIASSWSQVKPLINLDPLKQKIIKERKGLPTTWVFPAAKKVPKWITGDFDSIAVRVTDHPMAKNLCQKFCRPIVSTSANLSEKEPIRRMAQVNKRIIDGVDAIISGSLGKLGKPTEIIDVVSGKRIR